MTKANTAAVIGRVVRPKDRGSAIFGISEGSDPSAGSKVHRSTVHITSLILHHLRLIQLPPKLTTLNHIDVAIMPAPVAAPRTLYDKVWDDHVV